MRAITSVLIVCTIFFFTSCTPRTHRASYAYDGWSSGSGGGQGGGSGSEKSEEFYGGGSDSHALMKSTEGRPVETSFADRKVIYNGRISLQVKEPDSINIKLSQIAKLYGGYVQTLGTEESIIRVQANKIEDAMNDIAVLGKVESRRVSGNDVTDEFTNLELRLANALKARERYLELLAKAENVEAALKVEKELERINLDIDTYQGRMNQINHLAEYSTIVVGIKEKVKPGVIGYIAIGLYESVKWLFVRN